MTGYFEEGLKSIQQDNALVDEVVQNIFDKALESANQAKLRRILGTYNKEYLGGILCGFPDYLDEILEEEK